MAKMSSPIRLSDRRRQRSNSNATMVTEEAANTKVENVVTLLMMSVLETLVDDFSFTPDQATRAQDLIETRMMLKVNEMR